jgi:hypothetical protein
MLRMNNLEQVYALKTRQVDICTRSNQTSSELFKTGRANYLEVLITQQNTLQARLAHQRQEKPISDSCKLIQSPGRWLAVMLGDRIT